MKPVDLTSYQKHYSERLAGARKTIVSISAPDPPDAANNCFRNHSGTYVHNHYDNAFCPFEEYDVCHDQLCWIKTAPFLSCYFRNPAGARSQNILHGFSGHCFTHRHRYALAIHL
jgi:hypothetical protein